MTVNDAWRIVHEPTKANSETLKAAQAVLSEYGIYGDTLQELGHTEEAIDALDSCLALTSSFAPALYSKGKAFLLSGRKQQALVCFKHAFALDSGLSKAFEAEYPSLAISRDFSHLIKK